MYEQTARPLEGTEGGNDCRVAGLCWELCGHQLLEASQQLG